MAEIKLKPCPFCGEIPELKAWENDEGKITGYSVFNYKRYFDRNKSLCYGCTMEDLPFGDKDQTVKAWNMRSEMDQGEVK